MCELLFSLLRYSLWGKPYCEAIEGTKLLRILPLAQQQTVFGLVMDALKDVQIIDMEDKMPLYEAIGIMEQIKQQNRIVNAELSDFSTICKKNGLRYLVVKGQTVACLYSKPELRMAGDIDFLTNVTQKSQIAQILGVEIPKMVEYEVGFDRNDIRYELHTSLRTWAKKEHQKIWDALIEKEWVQEHYVGIDEQEVRTLSPTMNAAYSFIHLFFHFIREGVSLRQICDWVMVLHHYKDQINREELRNILQSLDVYDAYRAFGTIIVDELGLPVEEFPFAINEEDRRWKRMILNDIFEGGNFGMLHHQAKQTWLYKYETMRIAIKNSFRYYHLCPSEVGWMIPRLIKGNFKILFS